MQTPNAPPASPPAEKEAVEMVLPSVWKLMSNSKNMQLVRQTEEHYSTPQTRKYKAVAQYSSYYMLLSLLGLSTLNLLRGFQPRQHELKHPWSRPAHLFFLAGTVVSLAAAGSASYLYMESLPKETRKLLEIADDARIYMDLDKLEIKDKEGGKEVVVRTGTLRELILRENKK